MPKSLDRVRESSNTAPSSDSPRRSSSRTAAARLGIRRANRQSSSARSSSSVSMICSRSPRLFSDITDLPTGLLKDHGRPLAAKLEALNAPPKIGFLAHFVQQPPMAESSEN